MAGTYRAEYLSPEGCSGSITFEVIVDPDSCEAFTAPLPEYRIGSGLFVQGTEINAEVGNDIILNFVGGGFRFWAIRWTGPNGLDSLRDDQTDPNKDQLLIPNISPEQAGQYTAMYTSPEGCMGSIVFTVSVLVDTNANQACVSNLALDKPVRQSSTYSFGNAERAIDGTTNGIWQEFSVSHTEKEFGAFWEVDLLSPLDIEAIVLWNRTDCCSDRLSNFYVLMSETPFVSTNLDSVLKSEDVESYLIEDIPDPRFELDVESRARFVRIQLAGNNFLSLAEVEVWGCPNQDTSQVIISSNSRNNTEVQVFPNFVRTGEDINISLKQAPQGPMQLYIYDLQGNLKWKARTELFYENETVRIPALPVAPGTYFLRLEALPWTNTQRIMIR